MQPGKKCAGIRDPSHRNMMLPHPDPLHQREKIGMLANTSR